MTEREHHHGCEECSATTDELYIHSRCHVESPTWAVWNQKTHELLIECAKCRRPIMKFELKEDK